MNRNKSNVTHIRNDVGAEARAQAVAPAPTSGEGEVLAWLIFRPDTEEFLYSHKAGVGYSSACYVKNPELAYFFESERLAFRYSTFLDKQTEVVPLFDFGGVLVVGFA